MVLQRGKSLGSRLVRLQSQVTARPQPDDEPRDEDDWLAVFEKLGRDGVFKAEPDFPLALACFRDALKRAKVSTDPPFDPPPGFREVEHHPDLRRQFWRSKERFPDLCEGLTWLGEILNRVCDSIPPVTEGEFQELAKWFQANDSRLCQLFPIQLVDLNSGRCTSFISIRYFLARGPRVDGAGRLAEEIRQLRRRYGADGG